MINEITLTQRVLQFVSRTSRGLMCYYFCFGTLHPQSVVCKPHANTDIMQANMVLKPLLSIPE